MCYPVLDINSFVQCLFSLTLWNYLIISSSVLTYSARTSAPIVISLVFWVILFEVLLLLLLLLFLYFFETGS